LDLAGAQEFLRGLTPGAEVMVRGLGRVVVKGHCPQVTGQVALFYPLGGRNPQDLLLEDVVAMLQDMVDEIPEEDPEEVEDPNVVQYRAVVFRRRMFWLQLEACFPKREAYIIAGREVLWAKDHQEGTVLTVQTQVEFKLPG